LLELLGSAGPCSAQGHSGRLTPVPHFHTSFLSSVHQVLDEADRMLDMGFEPQVG
jgi:hypothetical protein